MVQDRAGSSATLDMQSGTKLPGTAAQSNPVTAEATSAISENGQKSASEIPHAVIPAMESSPPWGPISFFVAVALPAFICLLYLVFVAAPQYVSESRLVVRGSLEKVGLESIGQAAALSALNNSQEAHVITDYIRSARIVADLSQEFDLKQIFAGTPLDIVWHLPTDASQDRLIRYWQRMASAEVDSTTGIVTIWIHAFRPEDAQALNRAVIKLSETLIAGFAQKMRTQRLEEARTDSQAAQADINALLTTLEAARRREGTLDPQLTAESLAKLVAKLRDERATMVAARETAAARLSQGAPTLALTDERIKALDLQIEAVLGMATDAKTQPGSNNDLLSAGSLFDTLQIRRELLSGRVARAETALTQARQDTIRQQVFVEVFMQPTLGETNDHPRPLQMTLLVLLGLGAIWTIAALYFESILERTR
ncbi:MAG: hypothetical protein K2Z25_13805 [Beijerinckiaceae bacterium]|nr:hypothetical protein [Beijerinckiaceae bacterium]